MKDPVAIIKNLGHKQPNLNDLMRQKLEHAQNLLEAVVPGDHVSVERYANELTLLNEASTWSSLRTLEYLQYASRFQDSSRSLVEQAQNRRALAIVTGEGA